MSTGEYSNANSSLALRFLQLLPPRLLAEVVNYCQTNGNATLSYVATSREGQMGLPCAFWAVDAYQNQDHRHQALTTLALHLHSLEGCIVDEPTFSNYWQRLSDRVLGSAQDKEFERQIKLDRFFDFDEAQDQMEDMLTKEQRNAIAASPAFKRASAKLKEAISGNAKFLTMLRMYGAAIRDLGDRQNDISSYYRFHQITIPNRPDTMFGDIETATAPVMDADTARYVRGDVVAASNQNPLQGGFLKKIGKFAKKAFKAVGSFIPGPIGAIARMTQSGGGGGAAPQEVVYLPAPGQAPVEQVIQPTPGSNPANTLSLTTPQGQVLYHAATQVLEKTPGSPLFKGDAASESYSGDVLGRPVLAHVVMDQGTPALMHSTLAGDVVIDRSCPEAEAVAKHVVANHVRALHPEHRSRLVSEAQALSGEPFVGWEVPQWLKNAGKALVDTFLPTSTPPAALPPGGGVLLPQTAPQAPAQPGVITRVATNIANAASAAARSLVTGIKGMFTDRRPAQGMLAQLGTKFQSAATGDIIAEVTGDIDDLSPRTRGDVASDEAKGDPTDLA